MSGKDASVECYKNSLHDLWIFHEWVAHASDDFDRKLYFYCIMKTRCEKIY